MEHQEVEQLYLTESVFNQHKRQLPQNMCTIIDEKIMPKVSSLETASGCVGVFTMPTYINIFLPHSVA